jgi:hypothetical protein
MFWKLKVELRSNVQCLNNGAFPDITNKEKINLMVENIQKNGLVCTSTKHPYSKEII